MNNSTLNFTPEASTNSTTPSLELIDHLNVGVFSIGFLFGFPTHCYVTWLIVTGTGSGVALEFFILNLSLCEMGFDWNCLLYALSHWFLILSTIKSFLVGLTITGRPLFQCLMCVERYLAVVHPVIFLKTKPLRYRVICCAVAWITTLVSCVICMFTLNKKNGLTMYTLFLGLQFLVFFSVQMFCLVSVLRALKQSGPGERRRDRDDENHMKRRAFNLILISTASMTVIYGPYTIIGFFTLVVKQFIDSLWLIGFTCYVLGSFVQPVLYLKRAGKL